LRACERRSQAHPTLFQRTLLVSPKTVINGCVQLNSHFVGIRSLDDVKSSEKSSTVYREPDSDYLKIQGLEMDKIRQIGDAHYPSFEDRDPVERPELLSKFQKETLQMTESVYEKDKALEAYCRTLIADVTREHNGRKWSTEEMIAGYKVTLLKGLCKLI
jgi:hypothetical protein